MKKIAFGVILFLMTITVYANTHEEWVTQEANYLVIGAGLFDQVTLRANRIDSQKIKEILHRIRKDYPEVKDINSILQSEQTQIISGIKKRHVKDNLLIAPDFVELTKRFNGSMDTYIAPDGNATVTIEFPQPLHLPSLFKLYNQLKSVKYVENNISVFYGVETIVVRKNGKEWSVIFNTIGICMMIGCEKPKEFLFIVTKGAITKVYEQDWKGPGN